MSGFVILEKRFTIHILHTCKCIVIKLLTVFKHVKWFSIKDENSNEVLEPITIMKKDNKPFSLGQFLSLRAWYASTPNSLQII